MNARYSRATRFVLRSLHTRTKHNSAQHGGAWKHWESWTAEQRRHSSRTGPSSRQRRSIIFITTAWFSLSLHVRKSVKRFFQQEPVLDITLGEMRYPKNA